MSTPEPTDDIDRIRQARDDRSEPEEAPEVYRCPIDGCSRTVIGDPSDLRHHVRQSEAEGHRHRSLNAALEVIVQWEAMDWGWGAPEFEK